MANDLRFLANRMKRLQKLVPKESSRAATETAVYLADVLIGVTPVDTSKALSNWQVKKKTPVSVEIDAYVLGILGSTQAVSQHAARTQAKVSVEGHKSGQPIFVSNLVDYITDLNDGNSRQAPAGFVEQSVLEARLNLSKFKFDEKVTSNVPF